MNVATPKHIKTTTNHTRNSRGEGETHQTQGEILEHNLYRFPSSAPRIRTTTSQAASRAACDVLFLGMVSFDSNFGSPSS